MSNALAEATKRSPRVTWRRLPSCSPTTPSGTYRPVGRSTATITAGIRCSASSAAWRRKTGGTFRLDGRDVLANDEHTVVLATLTATRRGKSIEVPVANVTHNRDGQVTEFWSAVTDPKAALDFWA
jgi:hypothetical protein